MSLSTYLNQSCSLYAPTMRGDGINQYDAAESTGVACRFEKKTREIQDRNGDTILINGLVILKSDTTIDYDYKIVIGSQSFIVKDIFEAYGRSSLHHYELDVKLI